MYRNTGTDQLVSLGYFSLLHRTRGTDQLVIMRHHKVRQDPALNHIKMSKEKHIIKFISYFTF